MELSKEEAAAMCGGNRFFASVAFELREDFMREGMKFFGQGAEAEWEEGACGLLLRVSGGGKQGGDVVLYPLHTCLGPGITIEASSGLGSYGFDLRDDRVSEFTAIEAARTVCVARFSLIDMDKEESE